MWELLVYSLQCSFFLRFLPMIAIAEVKLVMPQGDPHNYDDVTQEYHPHIEEVPKSNVVSA